MHAIVIQETGGPEVLRFEEVPTREPGPGEVRVAVEASGVNFIDIYYRSGLYPAPLPLIAGQEGAGTVEAVGPGVVEVAVGDRVAWNGQLGSYATHVVVPVTLLVPVPDGVSTRDAATALLQGMTAHYLSHSTYPLKPGDTCLIHAAAGGVGLLLCQMAKRRGARVLATVSTAAKADLARAAGADELILYTSEDFVAAAKRFTGDRGVDVVYDGVGKDTFDQSLRALRPRGYLVLFGTASGPVPPVAPQTLNAGGSLYLTRPSVTHYTADRAELLERAGDVLRWVGDGTLKLRVGGEYPLAEAQQAHRDLAGRATTGKLLLIP